MGEIINKESWVYQSNMLIESSYLLTTTEQKLVRMLASLINKDDDDFKEYEFRSIDLITVLNASKSRFYKDIDRITDTLMQRIIKVKNIETGEFEKYHWVETCKYKDGILKMRINKDMRPFYLSLNKYTKYQLKNVMQFKSTHTFRIYELLKQYEKIKTRTVSIEELRGKLDIKPKEYPMFGNLKQKVIMVAQKEINEKTDIYIEFREIKKGRKVTHIQFEITSKLAEIVADSDVDNDNRVDITEVDIKAIMELMMSKGVDIDGAKAIYESAGGDLGRIEYIYNHFKDKKVDKSFVGLMIAMVKPNAFKLPRQNKMTEGEINPKSFNNFNSDREYDYDKLEKKLLGWDTEGDLTDIYVDKEYHSDSIDRYIKQQTFEV